VATALSEIKNQDKDEMREFFATLRMTRYFGRASIRGRYAVSWHTGKEV
jgi:hypothetical protein